jgi:NAD(P)-dependent dehydrogenase (short-subunit alcohol dehydrogenase family)
MRLDGKVAVVTGGAGGIGAALASRFLAEGAEAVVISDLARADEVAAGLGERAHAETVNVAVQAEVAGLVERTLERFGRIDVFCSNAGLVTGAGVDGDDQAWQTAWDVHVMAHVWASRAVLPSMLERGEGYLVSTASAAGLLTSPQDAAYAVSKHGAVALAEWLAVTYGSRGIKVSVVCPLGVATPLLLDGLDAGEPGALAVAASGAVIAADDVAEAVVRGMDEERFLILPHPEVGKFWAQKASDPDRWLAGVRRLTERAN